MGARLAPLPFLAFFCHLRAKLSRHLGASFVTKKVLPLALRRGCEGSVSSALRTGRSYKKPQAWTRQSWDNCEWVPLGRDSLTKEPFSSLLGKDLEGIFCEGTHPLDGPFGSCDEQNKAGSWFLGAMISNLECVLAD